MVMHFATLFLGTAAAFLRVVLETEFYIDFKLSYCFELLPSLFCLKYFFKFFNNS